MVYGIQQICLHNNRYIYIRSILYEGLNCVDRNEKCTIMMTHRKNSARMGYRVQLIYYKIVGETKVT